jgi:hypothetical protein
MKYPKEEKLDTLLPHEKALAGPFNNAPATADIPLAGDGLLPSSKPRRIWTDYSEEAIPERDPAYRLSHGTFYETMTVEHMPAAKRLALAGCLEQLGMSRARATLVASL